LLLAVLVVALFAFDGRSFLPLRLAWFDAYQMLMPRALDERTPVLVVEIDEASLRALDQWPWPRTLLARLVARIGEGRPRAIGLDIVMPEPDRLSPDRLAALVADADAAAAARLGRLDSNDAVLGAAIRRQPVVLGVAGLEVGMEARATPVDPPDMQVLDGAGRDPLPFLRRYGAALRSVDAIHRSSAPYGLLSVDPEAGVVRRVPLIAAVGGAVVPAFGLELVRIGVKAPRFGVGMGADGVAEVGILDRRIPTQPDGSVWIHYTPHDQRRFVSAAAVLIGAVDPEVFAGRFVIVGVTALAVSDYQATPVDDRMPGAEIHAQLVEGIIGNALLSRPRWMRWAEAGALAVAGAAMIAAVPALPVRLAPVALLVAFGGLGGAGVALFRYGRLLFDAATPAAGLAVLFTALLGVALVEAERLRRALRLQIEQQREAAARLAGELEAARRIQMGILPSPLVALAGERRISIYAYLEPAREVGGDLYDFFRLDDHRMFFLIGDVAGKGLPGSLFMAVSKALCKSTALRRGADVAAMVREANAEISRDNAEGLFVTAFAGILDARTGAVEYCNAGHEPPWIIGRPGAAAGGSPVRLGEGGGPPLCVLDEFPYVSASHRLTPGEALCLVTDGVTEATDARGDFYGRARLEALLVAEGAAAPEVVGAAVAADVGRFAAGVEPADDLAILIVRWNGPAS